MESSSGSHDGVERQAAGLAGEAREHMADGVESARDRVGTLQAQLADAMDSSANVLRRRAAAMAPAGAGTPNAGAGTMEAAMPPLAAQGELVATVLEGGATWLRENDLGDLEARLMEQIEQHPVRTLGIAAAIGFLVARRTN